MIGSSMVKPDGLEEPRWGTKVRTIPQTLEYEVESSKRWAGNEIECAGPDLMTM